MDFSVTNTISRIEQFQLKSLILLFLKLGIISGLLYAILRSWTFTNLFYFPVLIYFLSK